MDKQKLASKIWEVANSLRSKIKANEYKDYLIGFMFYKYLCDKEVEWVKANDGSINDLKSGVIDEDSKSMIKEDLGYYIQYEDLFSVWREEGTKLGAATVNESLGRFDRNVHDLHRKVFVGVFSTLQHGLSKLGDNAGTRDRAVRDIIDLVNEIPTTDDNYDVLGYIYEYLIQKFSISSAKEDGAFYTPHEVSSLISRIVAWNMRDREELKVYDPTCGSGGLLLNIGKEVGKYIEKDRIKYFGQELIDETFNLARMNLIMKGVKTPNVCVRNGDTLLDDWPYFDETTSYQPLFVDAVVSNPPYSLNWEPSTRENDPRFKYGLAPSSKADYAFLQHCLYHLQNDGVMGIVLPHGVLFRGGSEGEIRKNLIENNHIEAIIGLPSNLFYSTGIPTIIMILKKNRENSDVLFIDASNCYTKEKTQNVLRESDIKRIFDAVVNRETIDGFSKLVDKSEIVENEYNLNIPRYVSSNESAESYDLYSLMSGEMSDIDLDKYSKYWNELDGLKDRLFDSNTEGYRLLKVSDLSNSIKTDVKVYDYIAKFSEKTSNFKSFLEDKLVYHWNDTGVNTYDDIVNKLFEIFGCSTLVDKYMIYQVLSEKWYEIETDLENMRVLGFDICTEVEPNMVFKKKDKKTEEVQDGIKGKVLSLAQIKDTYFKSEFNRVKELEGEIESCKSNISDILEELDEDVKKEVCKEDLSAFDWKKIKAYKKSCSDSGIVERLEDAESSDSKRKTLEKKIKDIVKSLDDKAEEKLTSLSVLEVNDALINKWVLPIVKGINALADNSINEFIKGVENIQSKYSNPLSEINKEIDETSNSLCSMLDDLTGSDIDMKAIQLLKEALR